MPGQKYDLLGLSMDACILNSGKMRDEVFNSDARNTAEPHLI